MLIRIQLHKGLFMRWIKFTEFVVRSSSLGLKRYEYELVN